MSEEFKLGDLVWAEPYAGFPHGIGMISEVSGGKEVRVKFFNYMVANGKQSEGSDWGCLRNRVRKLSLTASSVDETSST